MEVNFMQTQVKAWGNSQGIRIPKNILEKLGLHVSDTLQIEVNAPTIIISHKIASNLYVQ